MQGSTYRRQAHSVLLKKKKNCINIQGVIRKNLVKNFSWKQNFLPLSDVVRYVTDEMLSLIYGKFSVIEICFVKFSKKLLIIHNKNTKKINVQYDS